MELAGLAGDALRDDLRVAIDEDAHGRAPFAAAEVVPELVRRGVRAWWWCSVAALVLVLVVCMLFQREDLRNRLIRLIGQGRISATTRAADSRTRSRNAGSRRASTIA